jgi:hypothetical protein
MIFLRVLVLRQLVKKYLAGQLPKNLWFLGLGELPCGNSPCQPEWLDFIMTHYAAHLVRKCVCNLSG